jgi:histidinol-phosphate aminotransferase
MTGVKAIIVERERLFAELKRIKWLTPLPSQANFILCLVLNGRASQLHQRLKEKGILVRYFDKPLLKDFIRISVGKPEHTDALMQTLHKLED